MKKEEAIKKIEEASSIYLNNDQKTIAKGIINSIPEGQDAQGFFDFIMKRTGLGFKFDVSPELATGRISCVSELESLRINLTEKVEESENKLIIGDNYEALKNLLITHRQGIDVIYIDPPYNTESAKTEGNQSSKEGIASKFIYKDKFGRNGWLNMMRDRLYLAKDLLKEDGVIFVSIDDSEQAYLKVLMDEIFGESNFVSNIIIESTPNGRDYGFVAKTHEYLLVYSKNIELISFKKVKNEARKFKFQDELGGFNIHPLHNSNEMFNINNRKNLYYPFYVKLNDIDKNGFFKLSLEQVENSVEVYPPRSVKNNIQMVWRWGKGKNEKAKLFLDELVAIKNKDGSFSIQQKMRNDSKLLRTILQGKEYTSRTGTYMLEEILPNNNFLFPKSVDFVKYIIDLVDKKDIVVLDFFAGSGTTGHAVMKLNKEKNENNKFILCTNNENEIGTKITYERLFRVMNGEGTKGEKDFEWIQKNEPYSKEKLRIFSLKHFDIEINSTTSLEKIREQAMINFQRLIPTYRPNNNFDVYYDLAGLNPYNEDQKKQIFSDEEKLKLEANKICN